MSGYYFPPFDHSDDWRGVSDLVSATSNDTLGEAAQSDLADGHANQFYENEIIKFIGSVPDSVAANFYGPSQLERISDIMIHNDGAEPLNAIEPGFRNSHFDPVTPPSEINTRDKDPVYHSGVYDHPQMPHAHPTYGVACGLPNPLNRCATSQNMVAGPSSIQGPTQWAPITPKFPKGRPSKQISDLISKKRGIDYSQPPWFSPKPLENPPVGVYANSSNESTTEDFFSDPSRFPQMDIRTVPHISSNPDPRAGNRLQATLRGSNGTAAFSFSGPGGQVNESFATSASATASNHLTNIGRPMGVIRNQPPTVRGASPYSRAATPRRGTPTSGNSSKSANEVVAKRYPCPVPGCDYHAARSDGVTRHLKSSFHNNVKKYRCQYCDKLDARSDNSKFHEKNCKKNPDNLPRD